MAKKKLDDIRLLLDPIDKTICIGQVNKSLGNGLMFSDNKKEITQEFLNMMMHYCTEICDGQILEWKSGIGTVRFTPKKEDEK